MSWKLIKLHFCTSLFAILSVAPLKMFAQNNADKPNILWLTSEDNSADWLSCYGNPYSETPNLDKLANEGFQYMNAYANAPVCAAQRSTWITGVMSLSMGTHHMRSYYPIPHDSIRFYPDFLREAGYYTGNWKKMDYNISGREGTDCWDNPNQDNWDNLKKRQPFFQVINFGSSHESKAEGDIENTAHDPNKTLIRKFHPDIPTVRKNYAKYYDAIKKMDKEIGDKLKQLEDAGLADNTIVIYVSDHGGVLPRSKRFLFTNSLHCPLIIRIPEKYKHLWPESKPGDKVDRLVSFVDMPKTWLSIAGAQIPDYMQGSAFLGEKKEAEPQYNFAFRGRMDERIDNARAISNKKYTYIRNYMPYVPWMQHLYTIWKIKMAGAWETEVKEGRATELQSRFFNIKGCTEELYDIEKDPDCTVNLATDPKYKKVNEQMRAAMHNKQLEIYDAGLLPENEMIRLANKHNTTIYEMAHNPEIYDVKAILNAADLALEQKTSNLPDLRKLLKNKSLGLRYWGTIGCFLLNDKEGALLAINDESDEVKAMAAWTLINAGEKSKGTECLTGLIQSKSYALLSVMNILDWMGEDAQAVMPAVRNLKFEEKFDKQFKYEIRMQNNLFDRFGK